MDMLVTPCYWKLLALFLQGVRWARFYGGYVVIQTDPGLLSWGMDGHGSGIFARISRVAIG